MMHMDEQYIRQQYSLWLKEHYRKKRNQNILWSAAVIGGAFLFLSSVACAHALNAWGVPGSDILVALNEALPQSVSQIMSVDVLALGHMIMLIVRLMDQ